MPISKQSAKKILEEAGAERVSESAALELSEKLNSFAYEHARRAVKLARHAKRKTVKRQDVELAF